MIVHDVCCVFRTDNAQTVDEDHYLHLQPDIEYLAPYDAISVSSQVPANDVDDAGYLRPQPSAQYAESHQAMSSATSTSATNNNKPSSSEQYCYVTPRPMQ